MINRIQPTGISSGLLTLLLLAALLFSISGLTASAGDGDNGNTGFPSDPGWIKDRFIRSDIDLGEKVQGLLEKGKYGKAAKVFQEMAERAEKTEAAKFSQEEAAKCFLKDKNFNAAFAAYRKLARQFPLLVSYEKINMQLRRIAAAFASGKASRLGFANYDKACEVYQTILKLTPYSEEAAADMIYLGSLQEADKRYQDAVSTYRKLMRRFPETPQRATAQLRLARLLLERAERVENIQPLAREARELCRDFLDRWDEHEGRGKAEELLARADEILAGRLLDLARFYTGPVHSRPEAARKYLETLLEKYNKTQAADDARRLMAQLDNEPVDGEGSGKEGSRAGESVPEMIAKYRRLPRVSEGEHDSSDSGDANGGDSKADAAEEENEDRGDEKPSGQEDKWLRSLDDLSN